MGVTADLSVNSGGQVNRNAAEILVALKCVMAYSFFDERADKAAAVESEEFLAKWPKAAVEFGRAAL